MKKYTELSISVYLLKDLNNRDSCESISKLINYSMEESKYLYDMHKINKFKHYSLSGLYPIERDQIYKSDETYNFLIRTADVTIKEEFKKVLKGLQNDTFVVTDIEERVWTCNKIVDYVDCLTPCIITLMNDNKVSKRWEKSSNTLEEASDYIFNNLLKKYNDFNNMNLNLDKSNVIKDIELRSKCGIITNYKNIKFVGFKFRVYFNDNVIAQELANTAIVEGIGEKNSSFAAGFTKPYFKMGR